MQLLAGCEEAAALVDNWWEQTGTSSFDGNLAIIKIHTFLKFLCLYFYPQILYFREVLGSQGS